MVEVAKTHLTARARARASITDELIDTARRHLALHGAAGLSLRAIARDLGMASSAVYRYIDSRDALLTRLIVTEYQSIGSCAATAAREGWDAGASAADTWLRVAEACRRWAHQHRASFELLYGTPVPGYAAPQETVLPAVQLWLVISEVLHEAVRRGEYRTMLPLLPPRSVMTQAVYDTIGYADGTPVPPEVDTGIARAGALFAGLIGAISAELFGHFHRMTHDPDHYFRITMQTLSVGAGLWIDTED